MLMRVISVGPFQSDALLVPEHCLFDHIHESEECKSYVEWNLTSSNACRNRGMVHNDLAILQPCGIARFSGVEFVCCPQVQGMCAPQEYTVTIV